MQPGLIVVVGAMRAGTTTLHRHLGGHPAIAASRRKEVHYFDDNHASHGPDWYRSQFSPVATPAWLLDATPNYMYDPEVCDRIVTFDPDARIVVVLRDPVTRAYSHYLQKRSFGSEPLTFAEALDAEPARLARSPRDRRIYSYVDRGRYLRQLLPYEQTFSRARMHVLVTEQLVADPMAWESIWSFLDLESRGIPPAGRANRYVSYRSRRLRELTKALPRRVAKPVGRLNSRRIAAPPMAPADRDRLREVFSEEIASLSTWLGGDLTAHWH